MSKLLKLVFWDVETAPRLAHFWHPAEGFIPQQRVIHDTFMLSWAAKMAGGKRVYSDVLRGDEATKQEDGRIVASLANFLDQADVIVAHNGDKFDLPVLNARLATLRLPGLMPTETIDTLTLARRNFRFSHNNLDYLARVFGLETKDEIHWETWQDAYHGDDKALRKLRSYNKQDVRVLEQVYGAMLPYVLRVPRLVDAEYEGETACPACGSDDLQKRGVRRTKASTFQRYQCQDCGRWSRGRGGIKEVKGGVVGL